MPNDKTPNLQLPYLYTTQSQKELTVNLSLTAIDAILNNGAISKAVATPPGLPADGDVYIVAASPTGAWSGKAGQVAYYANGWKFIEPNEGFTLWVNNEDTIYNYDGSDWVSITDTLEGSIDELQNMALLGVNTTADSTNKFAVKSSAVLLDNVGAGIQAKINKHAAGDTNSLLFQTNYSGRAEMGCAGDDNFHFKVSPNGSSWVDAIQVDKTTGDLTLAALTASKALVTDSNKKLTSSSVTATELGYVSGVTSAIQTQLNNKVSTSLTSANIIVGNSSNVATATAVTGDITISNAGVTAIGASKVTNAMLAGSIDLTAKVTGSLLVANGGSGRSSATAYAVICGGTTSTGAEQSVASVGTAGQVLTSNGASALPTFQSLPSNIKTVTTQIFTASGTYTPTSGMAYCIVECVGGGGGGGGAAGTASQSAGAGGGGGAGYARSVVTAATIGATQTVTIGAGGAGGGAGNNNGSAGSLTSLGSIVVAAGGSAGLGAASSASTTLNAGGDGGGASSGTLLLSGGAGAFGFGLGSSANAVGGNGGNSALGSGGGRGRNNDNGQDAGNYGGGGGGAGAGATSKAGGAGKSGVVMITEFLTV